MAKSRDAFRTISEVSDWLEIPAHVLRFWESRFNQIKPVKRAGGRRYYRPADMMLLGGIRRLLHDDGITIKGVQKILREKGVKYVSSLCLETLDTGDAPDKSGTPVAEQTPIDAILTDDDKAIAATDPDSPGENADKDTGTSPELSAPSPAQNEPAVASFRADPIHWNEPFQLREAIDPTAENKVGDESETPNEPAAPPPLELGPEHLINQPENADDARASAETTKIDIQAEPVNPWPDAAEQPLETTRKSPDNDSVATLAAQDDPVKTVPDVLAIAEIDGAAREQRIAALYARLTLVRNRVHAGMTDA